MATIGIDLITLSTPAGGGIGTSPLYTMRAPFGLGRPNDSLSRVLPPVDVLCGAHRLDPLRAPGTGRVATIQAESPA